MISIIITGRNDDHGGGFQSRLMNALFFNLKNLKEFNIDHELIFVEWNALPNKDPLSFNLPTEVKCIIVDPLLHRWLSGNKFIEFYEYFAKNVGASRSHGDFILFTNAEIMFGLEILNHLKEPLDTNTLYRSPRIDLKRSFPNDFDFSTLTNKSFWLCENPMAEPPHTNASGDFALCHRSLVEKCGGYDEAIRFSSTRQDGRFVHRIYRMCGRCKIIGQVFHVDHDRPRAVNPKELACGPCWTYTNNIEYSNGPDWGFRDITHAEQNGNITRLFLNTNLIDQAKSRTVPYPDIPKIFQ